MATVSTDDITVAKPEMSPKKRVLLGILASSALVVLLVLFNGGRPASVWFYPVAAIFLVIYPVLFSPAGDVPRPVLAESTRHSLQVAIGKGLLWGMMIFLLFYLSQSTDRQMSAMAIFLGATAADAEYRKRRGLKPSLKSTILIVLIWMLGFIVYLHFTKPHP